jgi:DNA-binding transcriptional ArsR family regulator
MDQNPNEKEIIAQLNSGRKTWTELQQNVKMSSRTLSKSLKKLMDDGLVVNHGTVESKKIIKYYDLAKRKEPSVVLEVARLFEKEDLFPFPIKILEELGVEQSLVQWLHHSLKVLMHFSRKILDVHFAENISPKQRIEYADNWKQEAMSYGSKWMDGFIDELILYSNESWVEIFGSYEDCPTPLLQAMVKFSKTIDEKRAKREVIIPLN